MKRKFLFGVIVVLLITNIATLLFWNMDESFKINNNKEIDMDTAVATIGKKEISYKDWMETLKENHGKEQLKTLINRSVVSQLAKQQNIKINDKVIAREIALLTTMSGVMSEEETNKREKEWREDILYRYRLGALLTAKTEVPEGEIREHYEKYKGQYDFKASIKLSHIIVPDYDTAEKVIKELDNGASFELLAQEYSIDEETKNKGGFLGTFVNSSQFLPEGYLEVAMEMEQRTYSEPFQGGGGIAIIYLHRKLPSITFDYDEIKPYIMRELALGKLNQTLTAKPLWEKLNIKWIYE